MQGLKKRVDMKLLYHQLKHNKTHYCDWGYESEIVTWERAEEIIQKFIDTDGKMFEEK